MEPGSDVWFDGDSLSQPLVSAAEIKVFESLSHLLDPNPRQLKCIVNVYALASEVAKVKPLSEDNDEKVRDLCTRPVCAMSESCIHTHAPLLRLLTLAALLSQYVADDPRWAEFRPRLAKWFCLCQCYPYRMSLLVLIIMDFVQKSLVNRLRHMHPSLTKYGLVYYSASQAKSAAAEAKAPEEKATSLSTESVTSKEVTQEEETPAVEVTAVLKSSMAVGAGGALAVKTVAVELVGVDTAAEAAATTVAEKAEEEKASAGATAGKTRGTDTGESLELADDMPIVQAYFHHVERYIYSHPSAARMLSLDGDPVRACVWCHHATHTVHAAVNRRPACAPGCLRNADQFILASCIQELFTALLMLPVTELRASGAVTGDDGQPKMCDITIGDILGPLDVGGASVGMGRARDANFSLLSYSFNLVGSSTNLEQPQLVYYEPQGPASSVPCINDARVGPKGAVVQRGVVL